MVSQAIVDRPGSEPRISIIDRSVTAWQPKPQVGDELHLGSQDLVRFAGFARSLGCQIVRFFIADSYLAPLEVDEESRLSREFVDILDEHGDAELQSALQEDFTSLYVVGVEMISPESASRIVLRRRGFIDTAVRDEAARLMERAWRELRLT